MTENGKPIEEALVAPLSPAADPREPDDARNGKEDHRGDREPKVAVRSTGDHQNSAEDAQDDRDCEADPPEHRLQAAYSHRSTLAETRSAVETAEYTPTISELREAWLSAEFEERDSTTSDEDLRAEFDRALAAHDADVRASGVPNPGYEYEVTYSSASAPSIDGYRMRRSSGILPSIAAVAEWLGFAPNLIAHRRTKAVPAGDWEPPPVEQKGAEE